MEIDVLEKELQWYKEQYELSKKTRFGASSEKMIHEDQVSPICDSILHQMTTQIRRELKVIPAQVNVVEHVQSIYSCRNCEAMEEHATIIKASMPNPILAKSMVSPTLLAHAWGCSYLYTKSLA